MVEFFNFLAHILGVLLNVIYGVVGNFGISVILFSILIKIIQLPIDIKTKIINAETMKISEFQKEIREKYKDDPAKINEEIMKLYQRENINPLSSCGGFILSIFQLILVFAMLAVIYSPLTHIKSASAEEIDKQYQIAVEENFEKEFKAEYEKKENFEEEKAKKIAEIKFANGRNKEQYILKHLNKDSNKDSKYYLNMNFLNLDLTKMPGDTVKNFNDALKYENIKILIIPTLYIVISFVNIQMITKELEKQREETKKQKTEEKIIENKFKKEDEEDLKDSDKLTSEDFQDVMMSSNKMMMYIMPVMIFSITMITPLGVALYWLANSVADIVKFRVVKQITDKILIEKGLLERK